MTILFIIAAIAFTVAMTALMIRPFSMAKQDQISLELLDEELREVEALAARKVALVQSLRDIEYDFETNKITEEDYRRFKRSCERQALGVMRRLEAIHGGDANWEDTIDGALAERLDTGLDTDNIDEQAAKPAADGDNAESDETPEALSCSSCGKTLADDDRFCSHCGTATDSADEDVLSAGAAASDRPSSTSKVAP